MCTHTRTIYYNLASSINKNDKNRRPFDAVVNCAFCLLSRVYESPDNRSSSTRLSFSHLIKSNKSIGLIRTLHANDLNATIDSIPTATERNC